MEACKGELEFASDKKKKEFLKGINENEILPCERTEEDVREAAAMLKHTQRNRKERKLWEARQTNKITHDKVAILNKTYFLDSSLQGREILPQWVFDSMQITKTDTLELSDLVLSRWPGRHQQSSIGMLCSLALASSLPRTWRLRVRLVHAFHSRRQFEANGLCGSQTLGKVSIQSSCGLSHLLSDVRSASGSAWNPSRTS